MHIGIDFDNTIISYDSVFNTIGVKKGLIPDDLEPGKSFVRNYLRERDQEKEWTWLQGYVYGTKLDVASPYEGVKDFLQYCSENRIDCSIISHKTTYPYSGDQYNLHTAASDWIKKQKINLEPFFELTKEDKVKRIANLKCDFFIDDLPEFLAMPGFPEHMVKVLFDPLETYASQDYDYSYATSWEKIRLIIKKHINSK